MKQHITDELYARSKLMKQYLTDKLYAKQAISAMLTTSPFSSKVKVEEIVPRYYVSIPIPYIQKSYNDEGYRNDDQWVFGFIWKTIFTFGKKKQERFLYIWEVKR